MRTHTNDYKNGLIGVRVFKSNLTYIENNQANTINEDNIKKIKPILNTDLFRTSMKCLEIELTFKLNKNTKVHFENGLKVNDNYEYLNYGDYFVYDVEYQADTKTYVHTCYDNMLKTMIKYEPLNITYPIWVRDYITAIATACGLEFAYSADRFVNYNIEISKDYFSEGNYTYRDILDYLCEVIGGWLYIDENNKLSVKYPTETNEELNGDYLNSINVDFNKKYGPVNSIVFARANELDNIEYKDDLSIVQNGLCRVKFSDNPFLSGEDRENFMTHDENWGLVDKIMGMEFYLCDFESKGITYLELGDYYIMKISDEVIEALKSGLVKSGLKKSQNKTEYVYKCLMLNDEQTFTKGLNERVYTEEPPEEEYITTAPSDNSLKNAEILVNKTAGEMVLKADSNGKVVQARLDADADNGTLFEVKADNIKLEGYTTINDGFGVDLDGNMFANGGTFGGTINTSQNCTVGNDLYVGQNQSPTSIDRKYIYFSNNTKIERTKIGSDETLEVTSPNLIEIICGSDSSSDPKIGLNKDTGFNLRSKSEVGASKSFIVGGPDEIWLSCGTGINNSDLVFTPSNIQFSKQPTWPSDKRLKKNIEDIDVSWIDELKVKEFEYKNSEGKQIGLIAQDYLDKEYVKYFLKEDEKGYYSIAYGNITNALIQYCQEMKQEINQLKEEIKSLKESDK